MLAGAIAAHEPAATPLCASTSTHACPLAPLARPPAQRALVRASPLAPRTRPSELCLSAARALVRASPLAPRARLLELCLSAPRVRWLEPPRWSASAVCARPLASRACMLKTSCACLRRRVRSLEPPRSPAMLRVLAYRALLSLIRWFWLIEIMRAERLTEGGTLEEIKGEREKDGTFISQRNDHCRE